MGYAPLLIINQLSAIEYYNELATLYVTGMCGG